MKLIANLVGGVMLIIVWFGSYYILQFFVRGQLVEGAAVVPGVFAAITVRNYLLARAGDKDGQ